MNIFIITGISEEVASLKSYQQTQKDVSWWLTRKVARDHMNQHRNLSQTEYGMTIISEFVVFYISFFNIIFNLILTHKYVGSI